MKEIKIAVCGNPNTGKSTLINALAGAKLQVGNWPGVTVEKKEVLFKLNNHFLHFIDLPGAYSLTPFSLEEQITRDFLFLNRPDLLLCVVDSTNLERNLFFVIQLLELEIPLVVALNMYDEAQKLGYKINIKHLEELLGIKVVPTVATKGEGIEELKRAIIEVKEEGRIPKKLSYGEDLELILAKVKDHLLKANPNLEKDLLNKGLLLKVLEGDKELLNKSGLRYSEEEIKNYLEHIEKIHNQSLEDFITDIRYGIAHGIVKEVLTKPERIKLTLTERIDNIVLNRYLGIPIFLITMWFLFKISFDLSSPYVDFLDEAINSFVIKWVSLGMESLGSPEWLISLIGEGIIGGVGIVLSFFPVIGMVMLLITLLESSGYMARAAFLMDRIMKIFGVQGKAFIPMLMGFGCNVPAVYATRIIEQERERKLTAFLLPFMSCGARLPVYVVFVSAFFPASTGTVIFFLYILGIVVAIGVGIIGHKVVFKGKSSPFIMELPPYRFPTLRDLLTHTWLKLRHFVIKAGTWILLINILVWTLLNLPWKPEKPEDSLLGKTGKVLAPIFAPLGFGDWASASSLLAGSLAKEVVVSTMAQIYGGPEIEPKEEESLGKDLKKIAGTFLEKTQEAFTNLFSTLGVISLSPETPEEAKGLLDKLKTHFTPLSALSFMIFVLLYWPCFVYGIALVRELGSLKFYGLAILLHTSIAWLVAFTFYQVGRFLGF